MCYPFQGVQIIIKHIFTIWLSDEMLILYTFYTFAAKDG